MLQDLAHHFRVASPKVLPKWEQYVDFLKLQKRILKTRFLNLDGFESRGFFILKQILKTLDPDIEYLSLQSNDFARYLNYFKEIPSNANDIFDPARSGKAYRKAFYKKGLFAPNEYICPVSDVDHIKTLPLEGSWEEWSKVKPMQIWYHDTDEYTLDIFQGQVVTKYTHPNFSMICLDTTALLFKYFKYLTMDVPQEEGTKNFHTFIYKHVYPFIMDDLLEIWLFNRITHIANLVTEGPSTANLVHIAPSSDRAFGYVGSRYGEAMESLYSAMEDVKNGTINVNSIFCAKLLPSGSIVDRMNYANEYLDIPNTVQYKHAILLRDMPIIDLMVTMHSWRPDVTIYQSLRRDLNIYLRRMKMNRIWQRIYDSSVRTKVEDWIENSQKKIE